MYTINWGKPSRPKPLSQPCVTVHLFTPEKSHSFTNPYIVVIKVAETRKGNSGQNEERCSGQLDFRLAMNVVSHNLAQSPERENPTQSVHTEHKCHKQWNRGLRVTWSANVLQEIVIRFDFMNKRALTSGMHTHQKSCDHSL